MYHYVHNLQDFVESFLFYKWRYFRVSLVLMMMGGLLKLLLDGWLGWHAIRKIFNLILKVRYPTIN